ncbi:MAG TPA: helix-hairpin-helix domain-containing protein [Polyangiaceae bacterium]|jgi:competence protein ComEA|nr:helix-hairpin-helix domain-containing protein [Polyangiaceae bacterium]
MSGRGVGPISINIADEAELAAIAEIGIQRAKRIIEYRTRHGEFESIEELSKVAGIDHKLIEIIRHSVTL